MKVIQVRSPYKIAINETDQLFAKVELFVWGGDETEPTTASYILEKQIPDITQPTCYFNISPYIKENVEAIKPSAVTPTVEEYLMWRKVKVVRFYKEALLDDWTEIDDEELIALNGDTNYMGGWNQSSSENLIYLTNKTVKIKRSDNFQYFNIVIDYDNTLTLDLIARYRNLGGVIQDESTLLTPADDSGVYMFKVPYRTSDSGLINGNTVELIYDSTLHPRIYFINEDECLYTPIKCSFINSSGGWQFITFFKVRTDEYETTNKEYNLLADADDYNVYRGQKKAFNFQQKQKVKVNTGWVEENYIELITELMNSETILLDETPVMIVSKTMTKKTATTDKMINYQIDFEYAFNLINDVD